MDEGQSVAREPAATAEGQRLAREPAGTPDAVFRSFYLHFIKELTTYVAEAGARSSEEAADIAQTAMIEAAKHRLGISDYEKYVKGIAFQELNRRMTSPEERPADEMREHSSLLLLTLDTVTREKTKGNKLIVALELLPPLQRQIMVRHMAHCALAEIAHELKITIDEVLENLKQARETLKQHIREQER
jgi:DNA-directed RNA polymerase specialized sigma24 family protein